MEFSLEEMDRYLARGPMVGIKLGVAKKAHEADLDAIIRKTAALKALIFQHAWFKQDDRQYPGESTTLDSVQLAALESPR